MRYVGIDIGAQHHWMAMVDEDEAILVKATKFSEDRDGYDKLRELLGEAGDVLVVIEATGHYWQNLCTYLVSEGVRVAVINPMRTHNFAKEELERTKTDAVDAVGLARFARQKRPAVVQLPAEATQELRELVRWRDQLVVDEQARVNQLHRLVDLGFPEFTSVVKSLDALATVLLARFQTARAFAEAKLDHVATLKYGNEVKVGRELAKELITVAKRSVGAHHGDTYRREVSSCAETSSPCASSSRRSNTTSMRS